MANVKYIVATVHHHKTIAIARQARSGVVISLKGEAFHFKVTQPNRINLRLPASVRGKNNRLTICTPGGLGINPVMPG